MKKHILGFAIFSLIVGSFVSVWALFGFFTQQIPVVPKVESERLPVFKYDKRRNCRMRSEKVSYNVLSSYYFADENVVVSKLKLKWNGYGAPPETFSIIPKLYTADSQTVILGSGTHFRDIFDSGNVVDVTVRSYPAISSKSLLRENFYADFNLTSNGGSSIRSDFVSAPQQVVVIHGDSSIIRP